MNKRQKTEISFWCTDQTQDEIGLYEGWEENMNTEKK